MDLDRFSWGSRTLIVGILNVTPDSFAGDGLLDASAAVARACAMADNGADIIDIGGESTRPGFAAVSAETELRRVTPVIERLHDARPELPISIDTTKPAVARAAFDAGAAILNDIYGLRRPEVGLKLAKLAAARGAWLIAMHNQRDRPPVSDPLAAVLDGWRCSMDTAVRHGVEAERIILDPGFGFGWRLDENIELLRRLSELCASQRPILVGMSRKRMTGEQFGWDADQRFEGSAAVTALAVANGADLVRVHDVAEMSRVVRMADAIVRS